MLQRARQGCPFRLWGSCRFEKGCRKLGVHRMMCSGAAIVVSIIKRTEVSLAVLRFH